MDNRIGTIQPDGTRVWPAVNIEGAPYTRPVSTYGLDDTRFVVLPVNFEDRYTEAAIRALVAPNASAPKPMGKKAGDEV